jgi:hypothetical protein
MPMPEIKSGEGQPWEYFARVDTIADEGSYRLALNPNSANRPGVAHNHLDAFVPGYRPPLEQLMIKAMLQVPDIHKFFHSRTTISGRHNHSLSGNPLPLWRGENGGIFHRGELYELVRTTIETKGQSSGHLLLEDRVSFRNGVIILPKQDKNGVLSISLVGPNPEQTPEDQGLWRGWIEIEGENPGVLVKGAIAFINQAVRKLDIPLWKQK